MSMGREELQAELKEIYAALQEKGYDPLRQLVGYFLSEDPTYITNHNGARLNITKLDRNQRLYDIVADYFR